METFAYLPMSDCPQKVLFSLGGSFLYYADRFKIYSAFCASHTKVPKVLAKGKTMQILSDAEHIYSSEFIATYRQWCVTTGVLV